MASVLVDAFEDTTQPTPDAQYVEEQLLQIMEDEFETMLEDGSAEVVARDVVRMWEVIQRGAKEGEEEASNSRTELQGSRPSVYTYSQKLLDQRNIQVSELEDRISD